MMLSCKSCKKTNLSPSNCGYRWIFIVYINLPCRSVFLSLSSDWNRSRRPWYHLEKSWKYFRTDSKILIMFAVKALYENQLFRLNQSIHTGDLNLLSLLVPFYQSKSQKLKICTTLWSFTLRNLITAWYHPPLMACSSHNFLSNFFDSRFILFGSLTLSLVERSALPCARCQAGGEEAEEENQPEKETPVVNRTMDSC